MDHPHTPTPDWAESCISRITKYDDPDVLQATIELALGLSGLRDGERRLPARVAAREDAARAAVHFAYRRTEECARHCDEDLGIAV